MQTQTRRNRTRRLIRGATVWLQNVQLRFELKMKNTTKQTFKWKWTGPIDKRGKPSNLCVDEYLHFLQSAAAGTNRNCLGQFRGFPWNRFSYCAGLSRLMQVQRPFFFTPISDAFLQKSRIYLLLFLRRVSHSTGVDAFPQGTRISNSYVKVNCNFTIS